MKSIESFLNVTLVAVIALMLAQLILYWIRRARKYRVTHGINFNDSLPIRILSILGVIAVLAACSVGVFYANKFGYFVIDNMLELNDDLGMYWWVYLLKVAYFIGGQLTIFISSIFEIMIIVTLFCAIDSFIIRPKLKDNDDEDQDNGDEWKDI